MRTRLTVRLPKLFTRIVVRDVLSIAATTVLTLTRLRTSPCDSRRVTFCALAAAEIMSASAAMFSVRVIAPSLREYAELVSRFGASFAAAEHAVSAARIVAEPGTTCHG